MEASALDQTGELADLVANSNADAWRSEPERFSTLKLMAQSPAHYLHARRGGWADSRSMRMGSGAHAILFGQPYAVFTGERRAGKEWAAFKAENAGAVWLNEKEYAEASAMAESVRAHPTAARLLFNGALLEQRIDWEWQGRPFRSTPDVAGGSFLVDLKCLRSADPSKVQWQSRSMHYHAQAAMYRRALAAFDGRTIKDCYLLVVENKAPYPVTMFRFTETALEAGDRACVSWMERLAECEQRNEWGGYDTGTVDLELPGTDGFVFDDEDEE